MLEVLAESTSDNGLLGGLLGAAGGVGFAIWYGYHVTTKTIPAIVNDFRSERETDRLERARLLQAFHDEIQLERERDQRRADNSMELAKSGHEALTQVTTAVQQLREAIREAKGAACQNL